MPNAKHICQKVWIGRSSQLVSQKGHVKFENDFNETTFQNDFYVRNQNADGETQDFTVLFSEIQTVFPGLCFLCPMYAT